MDRKYISRLVCLALLAAVGAGLAVPARAEGQPSEKQQVVQALNSFRDRLNVKDIRALVGQLPDEPKPKEPAGKLHPVVTTAEAEYTLAERKEMRDDLKELFREIPPEVQLFFKPVSATVSDGTATVECEYYFKAKTPTPEAKEYLKTKGTVTVRFKKVGEQWNIEQVKGFVDEVKERVPKAARSGPPKEGR